MQGAGSFIWIIGLFAIMYFMMIRPQQKQRKQRQELINNLEKGEKIVTIGGIHGTITKLTDETMDVEIAAGVRITMQRTAVGYVVTEEDEKKKEANKEKAEKE